MNDSKVLYKDEQLLVSSERTIPAAPYPSKYIHCALVDLKDAVSAVCGLRAAGYSEQIEKVRDLLIFHRARLIKYVDTWAVADLQPSWAQAWAMSVLSTTPRVPYR